MPSVLQGGTRRRGRSRRARARRRGPVVVLLVLLLAVAAVLILHPLSARRQSDVRHAASATPPAGLRARAPRPAAPAFPLAPAYGRAPAGVALRVHFKQPPRAALLWNVRTGRFLYARDPARRVRIASLTKMMTAILVADHSRPGERVLVTRQALAYHGSGVGILPRGHRVRLETMLYGLLLPSGNDAAIALAQHVAGTVRAFVGRMNAEIRSLGLPCTRYSTVSGFVDGGNYSCAYDLAYEAGQMLRRPRLARIIRTRDAVLPFPTKGGKIYLANNNPLLRLRYPGTLGVKTGYTDAAGRCLVSVVRRGRTELGVVMLHSVDPAGQSEKLFAAGFRALRAS